MKRIIHLLKVVLIFSWITFPGWAFALSSLNLEIQAIQGGSSLDLIISGEGDTNGCTLEIFAAPSRGKILSGRGTLLVSRALDSLPLILSADNLSRIRKPSEESPNKVKLYFEAKADCAGTPLTSEILLIKLKQKDSDSLPNLKQWLSTLSEILSIHLDVEVAFPNLTFDRPTNLQSPPDGSGRLFVLEQEGVIFSFQNSPAASLKTTFLDIQDRVAFGGERGLLGLAFHPLFASNGYFFLNYINDSGQTVVARYQVSQGDPTIADPASELILLTISKAEAYHHGGQLAFGPDGFLYGSIGDGGPQGDPLGRGQSLDDLLGSVFRIDVDSTSDGLNYSIPADNPFAGNSKGYREEIFAYGFRNPWRFSFDSETQEIWLGDVGYNSFEEVDIVRKGGNYGWNIFEGLHCRKSETRCKSKRFVKPIYQYNHALGKSITGGYVYRGSELPELTGRYIFGDFQLGGIFSLNRTSGKAVVITVVESALFISSFGVDNAGEILIVNYADGKIYKFVRAA